MMRNFGFWMLAICLVAGAAAAQDLDIDAWPPNTDFSREIHFWTADGFLEIPDDAGGLMVENLQVLTGGDQVTQDVTVAGKAAKKAAGNYMNVADDLNFVWIDFPEIDVLVQYFADLGSVRDSTFLIGSLPNSLSNVPTSYDLVTDQWEWRLFRIDNTEGLFGFQEDESVPGSQFGGVNGGTIRFQNATNLTIRAIAIAPAGTFGELEDINTPPSQIEFDPDQYDNLAEWDPTNGIADGLDLFVVDGGDQESVVEQGVGPEGDPRTAVRAAFADGSDGTEDIYLNWEILNEHFGPTTQPSTRVKICVEYYDDPALAGAVFGPEAYAGPGGGIQFFPEGERTTLEGTGQWRTAFWYIDDMKFGGVNVPTQAAARFVFTEPVFISRMRLGVFRVSGVNQGVDPMPDCTDFDPDPYSNYAEWDIENGVVDGLDLGSNGGDQEWIVDEDIGPANDKRLAVRPALDLGTPPFDPFINWAILDERFGPTSQPNAVFKVCVEYYDDPELVGATFGPEVYYSERLGTPQFAFVPDEQKAVIEGTGVWRSHSWVIPDMNFTGVNVGSQGAARFEYDAPVYISRVQYGVIRSLGMSAGVDPLDGCGENETPVADWSIR